MLTQERLKDLMLYDATTGEFRWRAKFMWRSKSGTASIGCNSGRYCVIRVDGVLYLRSRLAWLYTYGAWPDKELDHIDQDSKNDRIENLRDVDHSTNLLNMKHKANNSSGFKGVYEARNGKWVAQFTKDYYTEHLGTFATPEEAFIAVENKRKKSEDTIKRDD